MQIQPIGLAALAALAGSAFGQAGAADVDGVAQVAIDAWHYGEVEVARLLAEDAQDPRGLRPVRFAEKHANQQVTPADSGTLIDNGDGTLRWRLRLESTNGLSVNFGSLFDVPPSTVMTLRDADGNAVFRPITAADNQPHGELWTPVIPGRSLEVDVTVAADEWDDFEAGFWITDVNLGYRALDAAMAQALGERHQDRGIAPQDACLVDVACPEADPWRAQVNGVAAYTVNGFLTCSGSMLNNTAEDGTPYFYTAEHCGPQLSPASVVTYWNFQNSFCRPPGSTESGEIGDGEYDQPILGGATVVGTVNDADSTLLLLNNTPPDAYRVVYLGWERQAFASDSSVGISHPGVQEKRIAFDDDPVGYGVIDASSIPGFSSQLTIWQTVWELGGVNRGSSGSPLTDRISVPSVSMTSPQIASQRWQARWWTVGMAGS